MKRRVPPQSILPGLVRLMHAFGPEIGRPRRLLLLACVSVSAGTLFQVLGGEYAATYTLQNASDKEDYYAVET